MYLTLYNGGGRRATQATVCVTDQMHLRAYAFAVQVGRRGDGRGGCHGQENRTQPLRTPHPATIVYDDHAD